MSYHVVTVTKHTAVHYTDVYSYARVLWRVFAVSANGLS